MRLTAEKRTYWELRTKTNLNYIGGFRRSAHSVSAISNNQFIVLWTIAVCIESHIHTLCGQYTAYLNATSGGKYNNHYAERVTFLQQLYSDANRRVVFLCHIQTKICLQRNTYIRLFELQGLLLITNNRCFVAS